MASGLGGMAVGQPIIGYDSNDATIVTAETNLLTGGISFSSGAVTVPMFAAKKPKVVLWGDSGVNNEWRWDSAATTGIITQSNGVATAVFANHGAYVGCKIWVTNTTDTGWYGERVVASVIDSGTYTFAVSSSAAADIYTTRNTSCQPTILYANRNSRDNAFVRALAIAGPRAEIVANLGANSQTAKEMAGHLAADLAAYPASDLWVCTTLGANDVRVASPGSVKDALTYAKQNLLQIRNAGKKVLYLGWQSNNSSDASKDKINFKLEDGVSVETGANGINKAAQRFNREMKAWCGANNVDMISKFDLLTDPASATGASIANTMRADGVHEGKRGGWFIAQKIATWLIATYPTLDDPLPMSLIDRRYDTTPALVDTKSKQIFRNPLIATASGTAGRGQEVLLQNAFGMPAVSAGFSLVQRTVATDGDAYGFNQVASWATTGAGADQAGGIDFVGYASDIPAGSNRFQAGCKVSTSAQTAFTGLRLVFTVTTSNYGAIAAESKTFGSGFSDNAAFADAEVIANEWVISPVLTIPNDAIITAMDFFVQGFTASFPGGFTISAGRPMILAWAE